METQIGSSPLGVWVSQGRLSEAAAHSLSATRGKWDLPPEHTMNPPTFPPCLLLPNGSKPSHLLPGLLIYLPASTTAPS